MAEYYALDPDDGLTMNLGVNPLLQFGLEETRRQLCTNILNDLAVVNYVPFDSDTIGNPALDVGDDLILFRRTGGCNKVCLHHIEQHKDRRQAEYQVRGKESEAVPGEE